MTKYLLAAAGIILLASASLAISKVDCTLKSSTCSIINVIGDDPYNSKFHGYADATIRKDPLTGTLWMAYSWPHTIRNGPARPVTGVLDIHLAYSKDGGKTWRYKGPLFTAQTMQNPATGQTDYNSHEVMNLYPQVIKGVTYWYGVHSVYAEPIGRIGGSTPQPYSKRWAIAFAPGTADGGPMSLSTATPQYLGQNQTNTSAFPVSANLSSLHSEVSACATYFEPALVMSGNNLYLFLQCVTGRDPAGYFYAVFKTSNPQDHAPNWQWSYIPQGTTKFADQRDAMSAGSRLGGGGSYITQMDIAPGKTTSNLLAIFTVANVGSTNQNQYGKIGLGCVAAELASIDPPKFVYHSGQVQVDAAVTSSDSVSQGPDSCTYSPDSATGIIIAHKLSRDPTYGFYIRLMQSPLFP